MKIVVDNGGLVTDEVALRMVLQVLGRDDGTVRFSDGYAVEIKTGKSQKSFKVAKQPEK